MGRRVQCSSCMLCGGSQVKAKSIAIVQHWYENKKDKSYR
jgi:hypothetical protein